MANYCRTDIVIKASKKAIDNFVERFDKCHDGAYPNQEENPHIADEFGADAESFIDKIGSKWITKWDGGINYHDDTEGSSEVRLAVDTAWYPPSDMILEIFRQMEEIDGEDEGVRVYGSYWDEAYSPVGVFEVYHGQIISEEHHDLDESEWDEMVEEEDEDDDRNFWEEVVDPLFAHLQEKLDKVIEEI